MVRLIGGVLAALGAVASAVALLWLPWLHDATTNTYAGWSEVSDSLTSALPVGSSGSLGDVPLTIIDPTIACVVLIVGLPALTCAVRRRSWCRALAWWHGACALAAIVAVVVLQQTADLSQTVLLVALGTLALATLVQVCLVFLQLDASGRYLNPVFSLLSWVVAGVGTFALVGAVRDQDTWSIAPGGWAALGGCAAMGIGFAFTCGPGPYDDTDDDVITEGQHDGLWAAATGTASDPDAEPEPPVWRPKASSAPLELQPRDHEDS